jgi:hypothetical protein
MLLKIIQLTCRPQVVGYSKVHYQQQSHRVVQLTIVIQAVFLAQSQDNKLSLKHMTTVYRPRKIALKNMALAVAPLLFILLVFALSAAHDFLSLLKGLGLILILLVIFLFVAFGLTYVKFEGTKLEIVKVFLSRNNIDIRNIKTLKYRAFGTASLDRINIEYTTDAGSNRTATLGSINAYGEKQISSIVNEIIKLNPSVQVDERVRSLAKS